MTQSPTTEPIATQYSSRSSALDPVRHWRLGDDALICDSGPDNVSLKTRQIIHTALRLLIPWQRTALDDDWPGRIPYGDITTIRLRFDPTRFDRNRYRCDLRGRAGVRISIFSTSYSGPGDFEDHSEDYAAFIRELVFRVQSAHPAARVLGGKSWLSYGLELGALLSAIIALIAVLDLTGVPAFGSVWVKGAIFLTSAGMLWRYMRRNFPQDLSLPPRKDS